MANNFELITKYMQNAVDTVFAEESKTNILVNGSKFIDVNFKEAGYVKVYSLLMDGLSDYYRVANGLGSANNGYATYPSNDGYQIGNVDILITLEKPKLKNYREAMRKNIAELLHTDIDNISVKAGTNEGLDDVGHGLAIKVDAIVLLTEK